MRTFINTLFAFAAIALITSCNSKGKPNFQYFPNILRGSFPETPILHRTGVNLQNC